MEPDLARGWTGGSFLPIPYLKVQNEEFFVVLSNEVDSKVNWDTPRKHGHPPPKKRGKTFLNHLIFILKVQVITGFKPAPSALNYTLSSCGLVSVFFLFWFMWEKGITCFLFCFVFFGLRILVLIQPHGLKLAAFSLNEWPSTVPHGASAGTRDTVAYVVWGWWTQGAWVRSRGSRCMQTGRHRTPFDKWVSRSFVLPLSILGVELVV